MPYKDPEKKRAYDRQNKRRSRQARRDGQPSGRSPRPSLVAPLPLDFKIRSATQVMETLEREIRLLTETKEGTQVERSRAVGYLVSIVLRAIEVGGLEQRIEELEKLLKLLQDEQAA